MTSEAYVHIWLPGATEPVVCGRLRAAGGELSFTYGRSYLDRASAIPLDPRELPLEPGTMHPANGEIHGAIRDAAPDAWGRRVLVARGMVADSELDYLVEAGADRIGALSVSPEADRAETRPLEPASLSDLMEAARRLDAHEPLPEDLVAALLHGTSVGGARPKALLDDGDHKLLAKFSSSTDPYPVVRAEHAAMVLAERCGLVVAAVRAATVMGRDVLLVERFDRDRDDDGPWKRRFVISALTALQLHETEASRASYVDLAAFLRRRGGRHVEDMAELFRRMVFNILVGNTDDHARNHALFWDGEAYTLTPAYDVCPVLRSGRTTSQAMVVGSEGRRASLGNALSEAGQFGLAPASARTLVDELVERVREGWPDACETARVPAATRQLLERETVLGPGAFE